MTIKAFGSHLRRLREAKKLSQHELADLSDLAKKTITRAENGKYSVTMDVLVSMSKALEISMEEIVAFPMPKEKPIKVDKK